MKKSILIFLTTLLFSCSGSDDSNEGTQTNEVNKLIAVWVDNVNNIDNFVSLAKDGTYKMVYNQHNEYGYLISTGRYSINDGYILFNDNSTGEKMNFPYKINKDGSLTLSIAENLIKTSIVEHNAFENSISGTTHNFGGYTGNQEKTEYYLEFSNDYRANKIIKKTFYEDPSKNSTRTTRMHYIYFNGFLYLAEETYPVGQKYIFNVMNKNYTEIYYIDSNGKTVLP